MSLRCDSKTRLQRHFPREFIKEEAEIKFSLIKLRCKSSRIFKNTKAKSLKAHVTNDAPESLCFCHALVFYLCNNVSQGLILIKKKHGTKHPPESGLIKFTSSSTFFIICMFIFTQCSNFHFFCYSFTSAHNSRM